MPDDKGKEHPPRRAKPRIDLTQADLDTLVSMGQAVAPPVPSPEPPYQVPTPPAPTPMETANEVVLQAALADVGVEKTADDEAAIDALAKLDPAAVRAVSRWMKTRQRDTAGKT